MSNDRIKHPDLQFAFRLPVQIRFGDYDTFGHINNNSYTAFFDLGKTDMFNRLAGRPCVPSELSVAIVNINVDFLAPAVVGEPLEVLTAVVGVGERSFTVYQRIVNPLTASVKAQAPSVLAGFDVATQQGAPLSDKLRALLESV